MNLEKLVDEYLKDDAPRRGFEADWWGSSKLSLPDAILRASHSKLPNEIGRLVMHGHQRRPGAQKLSEVAAALAPRAKNFAEASTFEEVLGLVDDTAGPIPGVGELIVYDVAERIAQRLGLEPRVVYLHAGTREGAKRLNPDFARRQYLRLDEFPQALHKLTPVQIEDFLCIYKNRIGENSGRKSSCGAALIPTRHRC